MNYIDLAIKHYKDAKENTAVPGLMHVSFGGYHIKDVKFVAAFEVNKDKIGKDLAEAIFTEPNSCYVPKRLWQNDTILPCYCQILTSALLKKII